MGRKEFSLKKGKPGQEGACYATSNFKVEREIAGIEDWSPQEIEKRQQGLAKWASERWHVEKPALNEVAQEGVQEKYSNARVLLYAKECGVQKEYQTLVDLAQKHNLYLHPGKWSMMITCLKNKARALFTISPKEGHLRVGVWLENYPDMLGVSVERIKRLFPDIVYEVNAANLSSFIINLEKALSEVKEIG